MTTRTLSQLSVPIISAPMAGGPSTPELAAAVTQAGGLGMLAGALLDMETFAAQIDSLRELTFGVNLFLPDDPTEADVDAYAHTLAPWFRKFDVSPGDMPRRDDRYWEKFAWLVEHPVPLVTSTFGTFDAAETEALHQVGTEVWCTVTS
ncbi:MAG: nitronate monooxygenase, partial [Rhodococcus sp. (in: high G+C Gram-positive bacteria)]